MKNSLAIAMGVLGTAACAAAAQQQKIVWTDQEQPIVEQIRKLRSMPDAERIAAEMRLALEIRKLPPGEHKEGLADSLSHLVTEGDPGRETLQEVATTLALAVKEQPPKAGNDEPYATLAEYARYEHVRVEMPGARYAAAMAKLEEIDALRAKAAFTLADLTGKQWTLQNLKGKVVLVNFWATWCPPCRKEMPDLEGIYQRLSPKGLVVLAISDEEAGKVRQFIAEHHYSYPILLDPGRKVNETMHVEGIPKSFVYDRDGKLVAQAMDMRTERQFVEMLRKAGLE